MKKNQSPKFKYEPTEADLRYNIHQAIGIVIEAIMNDQVNPSDKNELCKALESTDTRDSD
jgi:hypothetical protein